MTQQRLINVTERCGEKKSVQRSYHNLKRDFFLLIYFSTNSSSQVSYRNLKNRLFFVVIICGSFSGNLFSSSLSLLHAQTLNTHTRTFSLTLCVSLSLSLSFPVSEPVHLLVQACAQLQSSKKEKKCFFLFHHFHKLL